MRLRWIAAISLLVFSSSSAYAEWYKLGTSSTGTDWYMDPTRVTVVNSTVQAWVKAEGIRDRTVKWSESKQLWSFNCSQHTMKVLSTVYYDNYGKVLSSNNFPDYGYGVGYEPIVPDTLGEAFEKAACTLSGSAK